MKPMLFSAVMMFMSASGLAAGKTYQVTGPILSVDETKIVVQKGKEKWEIARAADTKVAGEPKVGSKATVTYTMNADAIEVKPDKKKK